MHSLLVHYLTHHSFPGQEVSPRSLNAFVAQKEQQGHLGANARWVRQQ